MSAGGRRPPRAHVAAEAGVSRQCLSKWHARWRANGEAGLADRSSRPAHSPDRVPLDVQGRIERLRRSASWARPGSPPNCAPTVCRVSASGVHGCWSGSGLNRLRDLDRPTGEQLRRPHRYERDRPG